MAPNGYLNFSSARLHLLIICIADHFYLGHMAILPRCGSFTTAFSPEPHSHTSEALQRDLGDVLQL